MVDTTLSLSWHLIVPIAPQSAAAKAATQGVDAGNSKSTKDHICCRSTCGGANDLPFRAQMGRWYPYVTVASPATALAAKDGILAVALVVEVVLAGRSQADFRSQSIRRRRGIGVAKVRHLCP